MRLAARLVALAALLWAQLPLARAEEGSRVHARVTVRRAALRTGAGADFRIVRVAEEGEAFPVRERATRGYFLQVELADGSLAWIDGNAVQTHEVGETAEGARVASRVFAPPPLPTARAELAVQLGMLSRSGFMAVRPAWLLSPALGLEANLAGSVGAGGRIFGAGVGPVVNLFASAPVVPFFCGGGGFAIALPNADSFVLDSGARSMLYAGGGLRFGFRHRLIVRLEARNVLFFGADSLVDQQEVSLGLSTFL